LEVAAARGDKSAGTHDKKTTITSAKLSGKRKNGGDFSVMG
jgi:hypothetical protein